VPKQPISRNLLYQPVGTRQNYGPIYYIWTRDLRENIRNDFTKFLKVDYE